MKIETSFCLEISLKDVEYMQHMIEKMKVNGYSVKYFSVDENGQISTHLSSITLSENLEEENED